ncbi:hypothetical protein BT96DRAFT_1016329 [Gymnopus androsaceus JB14]|uniref:Mid2 domain-containing protein n=1 Tax=Gymnopus androsaceus JB14 TaxID=1447944 RepID=A0A6A4I602_9AGAR|nr:hypothetical protein BT96DRAFT_1016329 [Gymnopus androsaceus JB14]
MSTVWFMVDDTDSRLNYTGDLWSSIQLPNSEAGPTYNSTLHFANANTSVSFHFNGSSNFGVYGSLSALNASALESPVCAIQCTLDGTSTENQGFLVLAKSNDLNNVLACQNIADNLTIHPSSGEHELTISVTYLLADPPGNWSLDYITYESLVNPAIDGEILQAGNLDVANVTDYSMLTFGPNWTHNTGPDGFSVTNSSQSDVTMKFNGTSFSLYGGSSGFAPNATYKVDDLDAVPFPVLASSGSDQLLFTASDLGIGEHTAVINVNGSNIPFQISYFYVTSLTKAEQASLNSPSSSTPSIPSSTTTATSNPEAHHVHSKSGVIMGAVLGTAIPIILLTVIMAVVWTRKKSRQRRALRMLAPSPFISQTPFTHHSVLPRQLLGQLALILPTSKKNITALTSGEAEDNDGDRPGPQNLLTMKLEQRLVVTREQNQQLNQQLEQLTPQQQQIQTQLLTVHTDSGLRLTGEESLEEIYEVPPGYTES